ncbi:Serine/threonine-protein kinase [Balamuthia mandrillaris]
MRLLCRSFSSDTSRIDFRYRQRESVLAEAEPNIEPDQELRYMVRDYHVRRHLGSGAGARVYLGQHKNCLRQKVALKVVDKKLPSAASCPTNSGTHKAACVDPCCQERALRMARREIAVLKELPPHKNIIKLIDTVENQKRLCIVLEYADGGDLFEYVCRNGRLQEWEAWTIFRQIIEAIGHMHKHGFIHRDIKPENILLTMDRRVLLCDFGLGARWSSLSPTNAICGSFHYAAPEVLTAEYYVGPEVDLWSCGAVLYMMLMGRVPFAAPTSAESLNNILCGALDLGFHVSLEAADLLRRLLQPNSLHRATLLDVWSHPWFNRAPHRERSASAPWLKTYPALSFHNDPLQCNYA